MTHADRLLRTPATFRRLTGLTPTAFRRLLGEVTTADEQARRARAARPGRQRKAGAGRKSVLPLADRLLMLLVYYRTYVLHTFLGFLFGLDDRNVSRSNHRLEPLLAGVFRIPERRVALTEEEIRELFFDSTELPADQPMRGQSGTTAGRSGGTRSRPRWSSCGCGSGRAGAGSDGGCGSRPCGRRSLGRSTTRRCSTGPGW
jgi:uncharacterized membrane protein YgcG